MILGEGTIRVGGGYSLKLPGETPYSSQDKHTSISLEFAIDPEADVEEIINAALELESQLDTAVKLRVFAALGTSFEEAKEGVLVPVWPEAKDKPSKPAHQGANRSGGGYRRGGSSGGSAPRGGGGGGNNAPTPPSFEADVDGQNVIVYDFRGQKEDGTLSNPRHPDFKIGDAGRNGEAVWLSGQTAELGKYLAEVAPF